MVGTSATQAARGQANFDFGKKVFAVIALPSHLKHQHPQQKKNPKNWGRFQEQGFSGKASDVIMGSWSPDTNKVSMLASRNGEGMQIRRK